MGRSLRNPLVFILGLIMSGPAQALTFDANVFYFTDAMTAASDSSYARTMYDFAVMLNLNKKGRIVMGWSYASVAAADESDSLTTEYTSTEMGPRIGYYLDRDFIWSLFFTYNLISTADFSKTGETPSEWRGTTMKVEFGYMPMWSSQFQAGLKLNYYKSTYGEEITNTTTLTSVSYGRTMMYPSVGLVYRFD